MRTDEPTTPQGTLTPTARPMADLQTQVSPGVEAAYQAMMSVLYDNYTSQWKDPAHRRYVATLDVHAGAQRSGQELVYEPHVTAALLGLSGPGEGELVKRICERAGVDYDPSMRLYKMREFFAPPTYTRTKHHPGRPTTASEPDFVVAIYDEDWVSPQTGERGERVTPYVFVELKRSASVSFGYGYCNHDVKKAEYFSTQMRCYPHGCWVVPNDAAAAAAFHAARWLWIGPDVYAEHKNGPWGPRVGSPLEKDKDTFAQDLAAARQIWAHATLSEVATWLRGVPTGPGQVSVNIADGQYRYLSKDQAKAGYEALADLVETWASNGPGR